MLRVGSLIKLRPEYEERYIILHKHVFPGVLAQIRNVHIHNYSIFLLDGMLFSYYEYTGNNYDDDMKAMADEETKEWWKLTDPMQDPLPTRQEGEWWARMKEIIFIEGSPEKTSSVQRIAKTASLLSGSEIHLKELFLSLEKEASLIFRQYSFRNYSVFFMDNNLYLYCEYIGNNFIGDSHAFQTTSRIVEWAAELQKHLRQPWRDMKEVFHTD